ncbi:MAG: hypothetical protein RLZZ04_1285 [Cyanobacteriota bacterium]|jgi:uncharacterized protein (TIGR04255 family)
MQSVKFKKAPLIEVVFGMNIEMPELSLVHFGLYWETIKEKFPTFVENFGELTLTEDVSYTADFPVVWFLSSEENRLIRLSEDYFSYHCRCINEDYQHFDKLFKEFVNEWKNLESWWSNISEEKIKVEGYSLQYINLIHDNFEWIDSKDNSKVFNIFNREIKTSLGLPKAYLAELKFDLLNDLGELIVSLEQQEYKESETQDDIVIFSLSAINSKIDNKDKSLQQNWFISSHDSIIQLFLDLTTKEAQSKWGRSYE